MADQLQLGIDPRGELDARITRMLYPVAGETSPLDDAERGLLTILQKHMGAANAIWIARLAERLQMSPREVKATARALVVKLGLPVVGLRTPPYGYYLAISEEELKGARNVLLSEVKALSSRLIALGESEERIVLHVREASKGDAA